jgi:hypothetical protein
MRSNINEDRMISILDSRKRQARKNKYNAIRTTFDGMNFHSKKEARVYAEYQLLEKAGKVKDLKRQVAHHLIVNDVEIGSYVSDVEFFDLEQKRYRILDVKGIDRHTKKPVISPLGAWKLKHFAAQYGINVEVV